MLAKLLKKDFIATRRFFIPLLGGYALAAVIGKLLFETFLYSNDNLSFNNPVNSGLFMFAFLYLIMCLFYLFACYIMTTVFIVYDFYKTMVDDHGYLTHTLPVKTSTLIWSKLIMAVIWTVIVNTLVALSVLLLFTGHFQMDRIMEPFRFYFRSLNVDFSTYTFYTIFNMIVETFNNPLKFFACIAIGQLWKEHRVMGAILSYVGIRTATQIINTFVLIFTGNTIFNASPFLYNGYMLFSSVFGVFTTVAFFLVTWYILSRKLNLE